MNAYLDNPWAFDRWSDAFNAFKYTYLTNKTYDLVEKKNTDKIDILLKLDINVGTFDWKSFGYTESIPIDHFILYIK
jgi:hypothetical protein